MGKKRCRQRKENAYKTSIFLPWSDPGRPVNWFFCGFRAEACAVGHDRKYRTLVKTRIANIWEILHDSYWFTPSLMVIASIIAALVLLSIDHRIDMDVYKFGNISLVYSGGIDSAREILSDIAASIIAIAGVSFSVTVVALSLASSEYGPRLLRHYMRNTGTQIVLGTFVSTFVYCLLVYCQIPDAGVWDQPPRLAVSFGVIMAFISIAVFIYFIHHMSEFMRADVIINAAFHELMERIEELFPEELGLDVEQIPENADFHLPHDFESNSMPLSVSTSAYLQAIASETLIELTMKHDLLIRLDCRPGEFLIRNRPISRVYPKDRISPELKTQLIAAFICGYHRTPEQDVGFAIDELVEIALRALSPGLNDPYTAISCIDRLTSGLCRLSERRFPSRIRFDAEHRVRIVARVFSFEELTEAAFGPIRRNARQNELVNRHLARSLRSIIDHTRCEARRNPLQAQLALVGRSDQPS
jgi:uncharacterized membrane protein